MRDGVPAHELGGGVALGSFHVDDGRAAGQRAQRGAKAVDAAIRHRGEQPRAGLAEPECARHPAGMPRERALRMHHQLGALRRARGREERRYGSGIRVAAQLFGRFDRTESGFDVRDRRQILRRNTLQRGVEVDVAEIALHHEQAGLRAREEVFELG